MKRPFFTWKFYLRLGIVSFGVLVASPGVFAWIHGNYWYTTFDPRFGRFGTGPTLMFVFFGILIILFGLFSNGWEGISPGEQKRLNREWDKHHRNRK
jgi:hypothetical protein